jgi:energy-coupling factor transporter ATP-binding protein EcfA2
VQQELEDSDFQEAQIKLYIQPLKMLIAQEAVAAELGRAFEADFRGLDTRSLAQAWQGLGENRQGVTLPEEFDWERVSKRYLKKARAIAQESEKLRPIFAAEVQTQIADQVGELVGIAPEFDLGRYAKGLKEQYGTVKLESLDTTGVYYNELKLWRIFVPQKVRECQEFLPQVYKIPKEHLLRLQDAGALGEAEIAELEVERDRRVYGEQSVPSVLDVVGNPNGGGNDRAEQYAVILGDPGSGKSTLLQYLALVWAERPVRELALHPIPLLIELRSYSRDKQENRCGDIVSFIHGGNITCRLNQRDLDEKLKAGQAIALFDGIDEVFDPALRDEVVTDIHRFTNKYPQVRSVVTSRWLGYKAQRLRDAGFRHFMLQDLKPEQVKEFVQRWHELTFAPGAADKERNRKRLLRAVRESKAIRELAGNPLLLTMMAILNRNQELPRNRPELYLQASRVLLHQWDVERNLIEARIDPLAIDYTDKQAMLRRVAHQMQSSTQGLAGNIISTADLERILIKYLRSIEVSEPRVTARAMIKQLRERNFILCHLGEDSYAFVHRAFLEYFCAWEIVWQFKETQTLSIESLKEEVFGRHWQDENWHEVLKLICVMINEQIVGEIIDYLIEQKGKTHIDGFPVRENGNLLFAADCFAEIRHTQNIHLVSNKLVESLKHLIKKEERLQFLVGELAVRKIAKIWENHPDTLPWLKNLAQLDLDRDSLAQRAAIDELARRWKADPTVRSWIETCAVSNKNPILRFKALEVIAETWAGDLDLLPLLQSAAERDEDESVRAITVEGLARGWEASPAVIPILMSRAQMDNACWVRCLALDCLSTICQSQPEWFDFFYDRAVDDPFEREERIDDNPRQIALEVLLTHYLTHPKTLELLRDRAANDPDEQLRQWAQEQIEQQDEGKAFSLK